MTSERAPSGSGRDLLSADLIGERTFAVVRRGFDRDEVQDFLKQVAGAIRTLHQRLEEADEARRQAEQRALHPEINEDVLMERVGEETASILRSARAGAVEMRARAAEEAALIVEEAHERAGTIRGEAEAAMALSIEAANRSAEELRAAAKSTGDQMVERGRQEVESLRQMAEQERKLTVEGAQSIREKILADLGRRRRVATVQIEQLRAGRERLLESYGLVRRTLEEVQDELQRADMEARGAAEQAGRDWDEEGTLDPPDLLGGAGPAGNAGAAGSARERIADPVSVEPAPDEEAHAPSGTVSDAGVDALGDAAGTATDAGETEGAIAEVIADIADIADIAEAATVTEPTAEIAEQETIVDSSAAEGAVAEVSEEEGGQAPTSETLPERRTRRRTSLSRPSSRPVPRRRPVPGDDPPASAPQPPAPPTMAPRPSAALSSGVEEATEAAASAEDAASDHVVTAPEPGLTGAATEATGAAPDEGGPESPSVDGLFARIRAGREEAVTQARQVLSGEGATEEFFSGDTASGDTASDDTASGDTASSEMAAVDTSGDVTVMAALDERSANADGTPPEPVPGADTPIAASRSDDETDSGLARTSEEEALLERREEALGEVEVILTRKLKRALQDEQNGLLDRLRGSGGEPDPATLLGPVAEHRQRYVDAAVPQLELAARAGSRFALELIKGGDRKVGAPKRPPKVDDLAADLAATLSDQIRRRVEQAVESGRGDDHSAMTEALGAAYRETKTQRVERTAGDQVTAAFCRGIWEAAGDRIPLRWVVEDIDGPCPDCDDNALAGALPRHEGFPTGQAHPPAHTGCRCLVVPDLR